MTREYELGERAAGVEQNRRLILVEASYFGRRLSSLDELATRLSESQLLPPGWTKDRAVDALMVLTSIDASTR